MSLVKPTKVLVLHIEIPGLWADDLPERAALYADGEPTPRDYLNVVTEEWMRSEVWLTIVTIPGDKCMNDDFGVVAYPATIVGAHVEDAS